MFQDEARFGRMVRIKRCWAPAPLRPVVDNGYERQFTYVYGAISPQKGELNWMICDQMNTARMSEFLAQVSAAHPRDLIIMILDGASSHRAKDLIIPRNIRLVRLPAYAPELNPQEHIWDELREKEFPNRVFDDMSGVVQQLENGLPRLASDRKRLQSIAGWPWIISLNVKAAPTVKTNATAHSIQPELTVVASSQDRNVRGASVDFHAELRAVLDGNEETAGFAEGL